MVGRNLIALQEYIGDGYELMGLRANEVRVECLGNTLTVSVKEAPP